MKKIKIKILFIIAFIIPIFLVSTEGCIFVKSKSHVQMHVKGGSFTNSLGMIFNEIPSGTFMMGSKFYYPEIKDEGIIHQVTLSKSFYMQTTEVTQGQWEEVMKINPSRHKDCGNDCPVENISWEEIQTFIYELNKRGEGFYRLPTEAEWEYAARAGTTTHFYFGDCITGDEENFSPDIEDSGSMHDSSLNCTSGVYRGRTLTVASLKPNAWGLYDMHGNVSEWVHDWYGPYTSISVVDPTGPESGTEKVIRGGNYSSKADECRSAYRALFPTYESYNFLGFRLVIENE